MSYELVCGSLPSLLRSYGSAQLHAIETLRFSDVRGSFDRGMAAEELGSISDPLGAVRELVGLRRASARRAQSAAEGLADTLFELGLARNRASLGGRAPEVFRSNFDPTIFLSLRHVLDLPAFESMDSGARARQLGEAFANGRWTNPLVPNPRFPNLHLSGSAAAFLPCELSRTIQAEPLDIGSLPRLLEELDSVWAAFGLEGDDLVGKDEFPTLRTQTAWLLDGLRRVAHATSDEGQVLLLSW